MSAPPYPSGTPAPNGHLGPYLPVNTSVPAYAVGTSASLGPDLRTNASGKSIPQQPILGLNIVPVVQAHANAPPVNDHERTKDEVQDAKGFTHDYRDGSDASPVNPLSNSVPLGYGLNGFTSSFDGSHDAQRHAYVNAAAGDAGNSEYMMMTESHEVDPAALSLAPSPEHVNSNDGQSVGGASAAEESYGDAEFVLPSKRKRAGSAGVDGTSFGNINNGAKKARKPQRATTQRKPAAGAKSNAPGDATEAEDTAAEKLGRRESLLAADYSRVTVAPRTLRGMSRQEAADRYIRRVDLNIKGADNVGEVKADREKYLRRILEVFDAPYDQAAQTKDIDPEEYLRWQKEHHALTMEQFENDESGDLAEATATYLLDLIIEGHEKRSLIESTGLSFSYDGKLNCKDRLEKVIEVLTRLTIIRYDFVRGARIMELIANPEAILKRKEENKQTNDKKKSNKSAADKKKAEEQAKSQGEVEPDEECSARRTTTRKAKNVTKTKTVDKRGGKSKGTVPEDDEETISDAGEADADGSDDVDMLESSARGFSASIPASEPVEDEYQEEADSSFF